MYVILYVLTKLDVLLIMKFKLKYNHFSYINVLRISYFKLTNHSDSVVYLAALELLIMSGLDNKLLSA